MNLPELIELETQDLLPISDFAKIGSDKSSEIVLDGTDVELRHAQVFMRGSDWWVRDLQSKSGVFVNEVRVVEAVIKSGDLIRLASCELLFREPCKESENMVGEGELKSRSPALQKIFKSLPNIARCDFPVLLTGPSGAGKEVVAAQLHSLSLRNIRPMVSVNCSAMSAQLVESELFGHVKGSFTGATQDRKGAFEAARGGTLFLDEIGDLPLDLQPKLLRALENREIRPVGSDKTVKTQCRIIAATHKNLSAAISNGTFREDLYFRLNVIQVELPGLLGRIEDFEELLISFAREYKVRFSIAAIQALKKCPWPGNIRELRSVVQRAKALFPDEYILPEHLSTIATKEINVAATREGSLSVVKGIERDLMIKNLERHCGNQKLAAQELGMPKSTFNDRLRYYGIDARQFRVYKQA